VLVSLANVMRASSISDLFPQVLHKVVLPALNNASLDRSASVRTQLAQSLGSLLVYNYGASRGGSLAAVTSVKSLLAFDVEILAALIAIVADETKQVSARAVAELNVHHAIAAPICPCAVHLALAYRQQLYVGTCLLLRQHRTQVRSI